MSILIKGIDLPNCCEECFAYHSDGSRYKGCFITMHIDTRDECQSVQTFCPLIEIPTPHGRLIDGDELRAKYRRMADLKENRKVSPISWAFAFEDTIDVIDDFPTIIEAEQ